VLEIRDLEQQERLFISNARFELIISNSRDPRSQRSLKAEKQAGSDSNVVRTFRDHVISAL